MRGEIIRRSVMTLLIVATVFVQAACLDADDPNLIRLMGPACLAWFGCELIYELRRERPEDDEQ